MAYGVWRMAYGVWRMAYGAWLTYIFGSKLPQYLRVIVKAQDKYGKWSPSSALSSALTGLKNAATAALPNAPDGIDSTRWCTSLVIAFLRRYPEHIDELKDCYSAGLEWTSPALISEARSKLPPRDAYYELDPEMVREGRWKESVERSYELGGYQVSRRHSQVRAESVALLACSLRTAVCPLVRVQVSFARPLFTRVFGRISSPKA